MKKQVYSHVVTSFISSYVLILHIHLVYWFVVWNLPVMTLGISFYISLFLNNWTKYYELKLSIWIHQCHYREGCTCKGLVITTVKSLIFDGLTFSWFSEMNIEFKVGYNVYIIYEF